MISYLILIVSLISASEIANSLAALKQSHRLCTTSAFFDEILDDEGKYLAANQFSPKFGGLCDEAQFIVGDRVGHGAFGIVYRGVHRPSGTLVALKHIDPANLESSTSDPNAIFHVIRNEECIHARMVHKGVPKFHCSYVKEDGQVVLVMEFIKGQKFLNVVAPHYLESQDMAIVTKPDFSEADLKRWTSQLISTISYIHSRDVIFSDVKLENLMLDEDNNLRLLDFGFARWWKGPWAPVSMGRCQGTPMYMAPEHLLSWGQVSLPICDWYAVGIIFHEMLTGEDPYPDLDDSLPISDYLTALVNVQIMRPVSIEHAQHPELADLICQLCKGCYSERLGYVQSMNNRAEAFLAGGSTEVPAEDEAQSEFNLIFAHPWFHDVDLNYLYS